MDLDEFYKLTKEQQEKFLENNPEAIQAVRRTYAHVLKPGLNLSKFYQDCPISEIGIKAVVHHDERIYNKKTEEEKKAFIEKGKLPDEPFFTSYQFDFLFPEYQTLCMNKLLKELNKRRWFWQKKDVYEMRSMHKKPNGLYHTSGGYLVKNGKSTSISTFRLNKMWDKLISMMTDDDALGFMVRWTMKYVDKI